MIPGDTISVYLSIPITLLICILGYKSHSLSLDGSCCAFFVGILHFVAGWRYIFILAFFFFSSYVVPILLLSWSSCIMLR